MGLPLIHTNASLIFNTPDLSEILVGLVVKKSDWFCSGLPLMPDVGLALAAMPRGEMKDGVPTSESPTSSERRTKLRS